MYSGVPISWPESVKKVSLRQLVARDLGNAEVDDHGHRLVAVHGNQDVGRLDVAVNDRPLVGMLNTFTDLREQLETLLDIRAISIAVLRDWQAIDVVHHEERPSPLGGPRIEDASDVGMAHQRQRLPLRLEPGDHLVGVHATVDHLEGDLVSKNGVFPLGQVDVTHASTVQKAKDPVAGDLWRAPRQMIRVGHELRRDVCQQAVHFLAQRPIALTLFIQKGRAIGYG